MLALGIGVMPILPLTFMAIRPNHSAQNLVLIPKSA